jgi:predicted dehydrogenase
MTGTEAGQRSPEKILILGAGSIGKRHATNLAALGAEISVFDVNQALLGTLCDEYRWTPVHDLDRALDRDRFDAAVICTPNHLHIPCAQKAVDAGLHVFIEKPLSHTMDGVADLIASQKHSGRVGMAGFNLRFEPGLQYLKRHLDTGRVAFAHVEFGSYLPSWRPGTDYTKGYSANKSMGGGIILDDVHEIDYACWLFGYPGSVHPASGTFGELAIDVEDVAEMQLRYPDKIVTLHMDYLQRRYTRRCTICFRDGYSTEWVFGDHVTEYTEAGENTYAYRDRFTANDMYLEEMRAFLSCMETGTPTESTLENAARVLEIALAAKTGEAGL